MTEWSMHAGWPLLTIRPRPTIPGAALVSELERWHHLYEIGAIDHEEFIGRKRQILHEELLEVRSLLAYPVRARIYPTPHCAGVRHHLHQTT